MGERPAPHLVPLVQDMHARLRGGRLLWPEPFVGHYPYASAKSTIRDKAGRVHIRLAEQLDGAPEPVLRGVLGILLCRFFRIHESALEREWIRAYRSYIEEGRTPGPPAGHASPSTAARRPRHDSPDAQRDDLDVPTWTPYGSVPAQPRFGPHAGFVGHGVATIEEETATAMETLQGQVQPTRRGPTRSRKHIDPVGAHRSLLESYLRVTLDMGLTVPLTPTLSWSQRVSGHRFGHWDPDHQVIVISQILDDPEVPEFVLDYVVYHEVLHILHPVRMGSGTKRIVHSAAFRRDEKRFPRWKEGEEWITRLAHGHRRERQRAVREERKQRRRTWFGR